MHSQYILVTTIIASISSTSGYVRVQCTGRPLSNMALEATPKHNHRYGYLLDTSVPCTQVTHKAVFALCSRFNATNHLGHFPVVLAERETSLQDLVRVASDMRLHQKSIYRTPRRHLLEVLIAKSKYVFRSIGGSVNSVMSFALHCIVPQWSFYHRLNGRKCEWCCSRISPLGS